jgi:hypothetical protein
MRCARLKVVVSRVLEDFPDASLNRLISIIRNFANHLNLLAWVYFVGVSLNFRLVILSIEIIDDELVRLHCVAECGRLTAIKLDFSTKLKRGLG